MKTTFTLLISLFLTLSGCGNKNDPKTGNGPVTKTETAANNISKTESKKDSVINEAKNINKKSGDVRILEFNKNSIPAECEYKGNIEAGSKWIDNNGENILIISNTPVKRLNEDEGEEYLYAYCYVKADDKYSLLWNINDHVRSHCDIGAEYIPGTLEIIDLDGDGIAENAFIYKLEDRCDVSPLPIKLMMHSSATKLVIRGTTKVDIGNGEMIGGEKHFDAAFSSSPDIMKTYTSEKWDVFMKSYKNP
jgi:hypothetical protein